MKSMNNSRLAYVSLEKMAVIKIERNGFLELILERCSVKNLKLLRRVAVIAIGDRLA